MFVLCEGMKWSHLPNAGGIYDQNPELLDGFRVIFSARARHDKEEHDRQERDRKKPQRGTGRGAARAGMRRGH